MKTNLGGKGESGPPRRRANTRSGVRIFVTFIFLVSIGMLVIVSKSIDVNLEERMNFAELSSDVVSTTNAARSLTEVRTNSAEPSAEPSPSTSALETTTEEPTTATETTTAEKSKAVWQPDTVKENDSFEVVRQKLRKPTRLFEKRTVPVDPPVHYNDAFDDMPPRDGEAYVTFAEYIDCLAARLNVDHKEKKELPFKKSARTSIWPYVLFPAIGELRDIKTIMCNITIPIRHIMYVQNGGLPAATAFFDDVQRLFSFTDRLTIVRYEDNIGFAGAVNEGYRDALTYPFSEVPFFHLTNNDFRFPPGLLETMIPRFHEATMNDEAMIKQLEAEVASEPNEYTPERFRKPLLRSDGSDTYLVTSRLLPDRIRYMNATERRKAFADYTGALFLHYKQDTASWGQTRLAMETVGYWDENFYPAYYEDSDYRWRGVRLGFQDLSPPKRGPNGVHFRWVTKSMGNVKDKDLLVDPTGLKAKALGFEHAMNAYYKAVGHMITQQCPRWHSLMKWRSTKTELVRGPYLPWDKESWKLRPDEAEARHEPTLPIDVWSWDLAMRESISRAIRHSYEYYLEHPEVPKTIGRFGFFPRRVKEYMDKTSKMSIGLFTPEYATEGDSLKKLPT